MAIRIVQKNILPPEKTPVTPRPKKRTGSRWYWFWLLCSLLYLAIASYFLFNRYWSRQTAEPVTVIERPAPPDVPDLRQPLREALLASAQFVESDPQLARAKYDAVVAFDHLHHFDSADATAAQAALPKPTPLPAPPTLELVSATDDKPVVWLEIKVLDAAEHLIPHLGRADFEVSQNGIRFHRVAVAQSVRHGKLPRLALLLDSSGSISGTPHRLMTEAAQEFLRQLAGKSPIKLWAFANQARPLSSWTNDLEELLTATEQLVPDGGTALNDAVALAVAELSQLAGQSAIVLFTDGNDSFNRQPLAALLQQAKVANIPIHVVALKSAETKPAVLKQMAEITNGSFHLAENPTGLLQQFQAIANSLQTPVYRLAIIDPVDPQKPLTVTVANRQLSVDLARIQK